MSFNGSGTFQINSSGQPVVTGTVISSTAFNALTADLATGLSTCVTKDGQTATTVRVPFAFGISSTLTTDATSATTGSIITAGGISTQKALWVGTTSRHVGATQFDAALTYGGITLSNAVTGTGNMVLSASPTLSGTLTAAAATFSSTLGVTGAATFSSTIASGAITSTGAVTGSALVPTSATVTNGLGLTGANRPGLYSTSQKLIDWFTTDATYITYTGITSSGTGSALVYYNNAQDASGVTYNYYQHSGSNRWEVSYGDSAMGVYSYGSGTTALGISYSTGAATFASSVTATKFTATATGNNGLGLAAANTPALYASTTEVLRATTGTITAAIYFAMNAQADVTSTVSADYAIAIKNQATTGNNVFVTWYTDSNTSRGTVTFNRGAGLVAYNTTSDYRLKDLFGRYATSGETIDAIPVHLGKMKGATMERPMFVAHEVQVVAPYAVTGLKDAIDANGDILSQQLDNSTLVPALWAEVQSLRNRVRSLETAK